MSKRRSVGRKSRMASTVNGCGGSRSARSSPRRQKASGGGRPVRSRFDVPLFLRESGPGILVDATSAPRDPSSASPFSRKSCYHEVNGNILQFSHAEQPSHLESHRRGTMAHLRARLRQRRHRIRGDTPTLLAYNTVSQSTRCTDKPRHTGPSAVTAAGHCCGRIRQDRTERSVIQRYGRARAHELPQHQ